MKELLFKVLRGSTHGTDFQSLFQSCAAQKQQI
jgi:hypothetical protein